MAGTKRLHILLKWAFYGFICFAGILLLAAMILLKPLDRTPYKETGYYKKTCAEIAQTPPLTATGGDTVRAGWAKVNLKPDFATPIAIDANRKGKPFEAVHDSIYVRAFVFQLGKRKLAYVSADLLIIPPVVASILDTLMRAEGFDLRNIFLTATHTHTSIGAWHPSYIGEVFAGKYDQRVPQHIARCMQAAIMQAEQQVAKVKIGYASIPTHKLVVNRLVENRGSVDSLIRILKLEKDNGEKAAIVTFTAHATCLHDRVMQLSGDWPGLMMHRIDSSGKVDFCSFSAGSVGSHGPFRKKVDKWMQLEYMANGTTERIYQALDSIPLSYVSQLNMLRQPLYMRDPNVRVTSSLVIRPWLFQRFFGKEQVYVNMLQVGNVVFMGMPCDFSGELNAALDASAASKGNKLMVTSFNGGFVGYITLDSRYNINAYETRTMNWFGPENGAYFSEIITRMLEKALPHKMPEQR